MFIFERYIWKVVALSILGTWFSLTLLASFFAFLSEIGDVNNNTGYGSAQALIYTAYGIPSALYNFFPTATMIGTLLGLGSLSTTNELTAMRAAGISIARIVWSTLKLGLLLAFLVILLGEWVAPKANMAGDTYKAVLLKKQVASNLKEVWIKNGTTIVHISQVRSTTDLAGISLYHIDLPNGQLSHIERATEGQFSNGRWILKNITTQQFSTSKITTSTQAERIETDFITPDMLNLAAMRPQQLAANELANFIEHQKANELNSAPYELAYWTHFTNPLATLVMIILAAPLVFGSQRSAGAGQRVFIGILIGLGFYLLSRIAGSSSLVYGFPPLLAATAPLILFLTVGLILLFRVR